MYLCVGDKDQGKICVWVCICVWEIKTRVKYVYGCIHVPTFAFATANKCRLKYDLSLISLNPLFIAVETFTFTD